MDTNRKPQHDVALWGEGRWSECWNAEDGVGMFIHSGRLRGHLDLWWARTMAFLPDGRIAVDRSWGRAQDDRGLYTGNVTLLSTETGWTSTFDGGAELTTIEGMARGVRGASAPTIPLRWDVTAEAVSPVWHMGGHHGEPDQEFASDSYVQQSFRTTGSLTAGDKTYSLEGVGYKDHSSGARNWDNFGSHHFTLVRVGGFTMHAIAIFGLNDAPQGQMGVFFFDDGERADLAEIEMPPLEDALGTPLEFDVRVRPADRDALTLRVSLEHQLAITITDDNDNINGVDWEIEGDPLVVVTSFSRITAPDGSVGYAHLERSHRRSRLPRPPAEPRRAYVDQ